MYWLFILFKNIKMKYALFSTLSTNLHWEDLVLDNETLQQVNNIKASFLKYSPVSKRVLKNKSQIVLFYGAATKTKTDVAALLGDALNKPVYKVNFSALLSTYIGETEKNLTQLFNEAEKAGAILFFDEADALFGKRTEIKDAHDRYANIEVSYLLQKLEDAHGIVIVSTRAKDYLDVVFTKRLNADIAFLP